MEAALRSLPEEIYDARAWLDWSRVSTTSERKPDCLRLSAERPRCAAHDYRSGLPRVHATRRQSRRAQNEQTRYTEVKLGVQNQAWCLPCRLRGAARTRDTDSHTRDPGRAGGDTHRRAVGPAQPPAPRRTRSTNTIIAIILRLSISCATMSRPRVETAVIHTNAPPRAPLRLRSESRNPTKPQTRNPQNETLAARPKRSNTRDERESHCGSLVSQRPSRRPRSPTRPPRDTNDPSPRNALTHIGFGSHHSRERSDPCI